MLRYRLPWECIEAIIVLLSCVYYNPQDARLVCMRKGSGPRRLFRQPCLGIAYQRFKIATDFRLLYIQAQCLRLITTVDAASAKGQVDVLDAWKKARLPMIYSTRAIDCASNNGHIAVLEWWKRSGLIMKTAGRAALFPVSRTRTVSGGAMDLASRNGYIHVLEWWKHSGLDIDVQYSEKAMDCASEYGPAGLTVLDWWKHSGLECKYSNQALILASHYAHFPVLEWWNDYLDLRNYYIPYQAFNEAIRRGHVRVLEWWYTRCKPTCSRRFVSHLLERGACGPPSTPLPSVENGVTIDSDTIDIHVMEWLETHYNRDGNPLI